jgi:hypothetical protein
MKREPVTKPPKPLTKADIVALADDIRDLLADPDAGLTATTRARWEGALAALEAVLGLRSSLIEDPELL